MRTLPLLMTGALASTATSAVVWAAIEFERQHTPYYEIVEDRLVITTASTPLVNRSVEGVLQAIRPHAVDAEAAIDSSEYHFTAEAWFSRSPLFSTLRERAANTVFTQLDAAGNRVRVELFTSSDSPTFIFVENSSRNCRAAVTRQIADRLADDGVRPR